MLEKIRTTIKETEMKYNSGYTILETMVSVGLFLVVVIYGMGSILNANLVHKKSGDLRSIMDNLNYVMEEMSRNIRTGYNYHCYDVDKSLEIETTPLSCPADYGGYAISFEAGAGDPTDPNDQWVYAIGNVYDNAVSRNTGPDHSTNKYVRLTHQNTNDGTDEGANIVINNSRSGFVVLGAESPDSGDKKQPLVIITLEGQIDYKGTSTPFFLQTSVSQRRLDI